MAEELLISLIDLLIELIHEPGVARGHIKGTCQSRSCVIIQAIDNRSRYEEDLVSKPNQIFHPYFSKDHHDQKTCYWRKELTNICAFLSPLQG